MSSSWRRMSLPQAKIARSRPPRRRIPTRPRSAVVCGPARVRFGVLDQARLARSGKMVGDRSPSRPPRLRRRSDAPAAGPAWPVPPLAPALRAFGGAARRWVSSSSPRQTAIRRPARAEWQLTRAMRERISIRRRRDAEWQFGCGRPPRSSRTPRRLPRTSRLRQRRLGRGRPEGVSLAQGSRFGGHALYSGSRRRPRC